MSQTWDSNFNNTPVIDDDISEGAAAIQDTREAVYERLAHEHETAESGTAGTAINDGWHLPGSAKAYYGSVPITRPNSVTPLDLKDNGRLWIDSEQRLNFYDSDLGWLPALPATPTLGSPESPVTLTATNPDGYLIPKGWWYATITTALGNGKTITINSGEFTIMSVASNTTTQNIARGLIMSDGINTRALVASGSGTLQLLKVA